MGSSQPSTRLIQVCFGKVALACAISGGLVSAAYSVETTGPGELPGRADIQREISAYFSTLDPPLEPYDIISLKEIKPMLDSPSFGWLEGHRKRLLARVLPESDFLVRELRTRRGKVFAKQVAETPGALDRIDRLRAGGTQAAAKIIQSKKGYQWILYLAASPKGQRESKWIEQSGMPYGKDFAKPTGRIYTKKMLIDAVDEVRDQMTRPEPERGIEVGRRR